MVRVKASHILVKTESEAKQIMQKLAAGDDFAKLAKMYSQCPSGNAGGDLGYFGKGQMVKPFETACFNAKAGDVVGPVKTHVFQPCLWLSRFAPSPIAYAFRGGAIRFMGFTG